MVETPNNYEWAYQQLLWEVGFMMGTEGAWENYLFEQMVKRNGQDRPEWQDLSPGRRAIVVAGAIDRLVGDRRIEAVPGKTQATGRRCFRVVNVLDTIVAALEADDLLDDG